MLEEKTINKQLNGHQIEKEAQKYDEIDLTDEKTLNDSSKTFASFMNKVAQSQQPSNSIKLAQNSTNTTTASTIVDSSPNKSLFSFNKAKSDEKLLNKSDDTVTPSSSSGSLFKFGSNNSGTSSSSSSSSISSNLSSSAETSSQKEATLKKDFSISSNTDSNTINTKSSDSFKPNLFSSSIQANTVTPSFKFGSVSTSNSSLSATETTSTTSLKRSTETTDSTAKNQNETSPSKITKFTTTKNENPSLLPASNPSTTASNFFSFLNKPASSSTESATTTPITSNTLKPFSGFDSFKPSTTTGATSSLFTSGLNNTPASNLLGSNSISNASATTTSTTTTTTATPAPFFSFQSNLNANKSTNLFGNSPFVKSDNPSPFGGSSVFSSATTPFGAGANTANEGGDADDGK